MQFNNRHKLTPYALLFLLLMNVWNGKCLTYHIIDVSSFSSTSHDVLFRYYMLLTFRHQLHSSFSHFLNLFLIFFFIFRLSTACEEIIEERLLVSWNIRKLSAQNMLEDFAAVSWNWRYIDEKIHQGENGCGTKNKYGNKFSY